MAAQQFRGFGAALFVVGLVLLVVAGAVGAGSGKDYQLLAAGAMVGFGVAAGLSFVASAIIYLADRDRPS